MASVYKPWLAREAHPDLWFKNARIIQPSTGTVSEPSTIRISKGLIAEITPNISETPGNAIDLQGYYLCPGLIDCHVHLTAVAGGTRMRDIYDAHPDTIAFRTAWNAKQMLLRGFTTARDTGGANAALKTAIAEGLVAGPRLFISGKALSQTGGHGDLRQPYQDDSLKCCSGHGPGWARICDGVPACLEAARDELRRGADQLKIMVGGGVSSPVDPLEMTQFTADEIKAITQSAKNLGTYATAHAYTNEAIRHAVDNGVMCIEHGSFIDADTAKYLAERKVTVVPTLITYKAMITPPYDTFLPEDGRAKSQQVIDSGVESLKLLHAAGVMMMCYGSDLLAGMAVRQHEEWELRAPAGLSNQELLKMATTNAAKLLKMEGKIGVVVKGAIADMLVLKGNPLEDLEVFKDMEKNCLGIVKDGRVVMSRLEESGFIVDGIYR